MRLIIFLLFTFYFLPIIIIIIINKSHVHKSVLFDLPTHLPNEAHNQPETKSEITPSNQVVVEKVDVDDDEEEEEEELQAKSNGPICIPGTSITLQTEEDIAKWIEERKKNWPTNKNIERKKQELESKNNNNNNKRGNNKMNLHNNHLKIKKYLSILSDE